MPYTEEKPKDQMRIWIDGCFDLAHYGHANSLRQAKLCGDVLVVGVHNDADIIANKGTPVMNESERYRMMRAIKWGDELIEGSTYFPTAQTVSEHNCQLATHGDDLSVTLDGRDPYASLRDAGVLKLYKRTHGISTTDIIRRVLNMDRPAAVLNGSHNDKTGTFVPASHWLSQFSERKPPKHGQRVVYIPGIWDLLHPGHLDRLEAAKAHGDYLLVGIYTDEIVTAIRGAGHPIMNVIERSLSLLASSIVSDVVIGAPYLITADLIDQMQIDVVCVKSSDYSGGQDPNAEVRQQGKLVELNVEATVTTDDIITRILQQRPMYEERNINKRILESAS